MFDQIINAQGLYFFFSQLNCFCMYFGLLFLPWELDKGLICKLDVRLDYLNANGVLFAKRYFVKYSTKILIVK